ncbi:MAG: hypothetical protein V4511_15615 [Bacteroidota bacterium]
MKTKILNIFLLVVLYQLNCYSQDKCSFSVYVDECQLYQDFTKAPDSVELKLSGKKIAKLLLYDCRGKMNLRIYNGNKLITEGSYINATDTTIVESIGTNIITGEEKREFSKVFKPQKDGIWLYYNNKGKFERKDIYQEGKLINSSTSRH